MRDRYDELNDGFADNLTTLEKNQAAKVILEIQDMEAKKCRFYIILKVVVCAAFLLSCIFRLLSIVIFPQMYLEDVAEVARKQEDHGYNGASSYSLIRYEILNIALIPTTVLIAIKLVKNDLKDKAIWDTYQVVKAKVVSVQNTRAVFELTNNGSLISIIISADERRKLQNTDSVVMINFNGLLVRAEKDPDGIMFYRNNGRTKFHIVFADLNSV